MRVLPYLIIATCKEIADDPLLVQQRFRQIEERKSQYQWKSQPHGLPSCIDEDIPNISRPADEEFHRAKGIIFCQMDSKDCSAMASSLN